MLGDTSGLRGGAALPAVGPEPLVANGEDLDAGNVQLAQGRHHRNSRRCYNRTRNVRYRDRHGRIRHRQVTERVCR
ncbi:hypothetical protein [Roseococcus sp.]|uniref:hypothetical protein n=1 Tax=Roseococcus sp. TaxID=2109646 RepID=UPI003BAD990E